MSTATLSDVDLGFLVSKRSMRPPISSMPGTEVMPGSTLAEWVSQQLHGDERGTPDFEAYLLRVAKKLGVT